MEDDEQEPVRGRTGSSSRPSALPSGEHRAGAVQGRPGGSSTLPPSPAPSSGKRRVAEEGGALDCLPLPPPPPPAPSGRSAATGDSVEGLNLPAACSSGSNTNKKQEPVRGRTRASSRPFALPSGEHRGGAAQGRAGDSLTLPPSPPPSNEKRRGAEEGSAVDCSPLPPPPPPPAPSGRSAVTGDNVEGLNLSAACSSGSSTNRKDICRKEGNQSHKGSLSTEFLKKHPADIQQRRPTLIKVLRQKVHASQPQCRRDSVDISGRRRWRLRRRKINWPAILRAWPDEANYCAPDASLGVKVARHTKNSGKKSKMIPDPAEKLQTACRGRTTNKRTRGPGAMLPSNCHGGTSPTKRRIFPVRTAVDLNNQDPDMIRIMLPNNLSGTELDELFQQTVRRGFTKFVNNRAFQLAVLRRFCSIYNAEVSARNIRK